MRPSVHPPRALLTPGRLPPAAARQLLLADPGRVLAGEHPAEAPAREVAPAIDALLDAGIRQFIDLTEDGERAAYAPALRERCAAIRGLQRWPFATASRFAISTCHRRH